MVYYPADMTDTQSRPVLYPAIHVVPRHDSGQIT